VKRDLEHAPLHEPLSPRRGRSKGFSDLIGPLRKYLRRQVGRPWDKVYSEICQHIRSTNTVQRHLLEHLWWEIQVNVIEVDGHLHVLPSHRWLRATLRQNQLYVCPRTRLVKVYEVCRKKCCYKSPDGWWASDLRLVRYNDKKGHWQVIDFRPIPASDPLVSAVDVLLQKRVFSSPSRVGLQQELFREYGRADVYAFQVRRASTWDRSIWGLSNRRPH
jgi:hypothetical protein